MAVKIVKRFRVNDSLQIILEDGTVLPQGGEQGPQGPPGTTLWSGITDKPSEFPLETHSHDSSYDPLGAASAEMDDHETDYNHGLLHPNTWDHANTLDHDGGAQDAIIAGKTTLSAVKADTDIADAISKKHTEAHNHDNSYEAKNVNIQTHVGSSHAPADAQKNSDITKAEIEAKLTGTISSHSHAGGSTPAWKGNIVAPWKDGDPHWIIDSMLHNPVHATPTNISITVARCAFFKLDTPITVNKIRWFGVGATTGIYRVALYRLSDLARLAILNDFNTAAQAWGSGAFSVSLEAGVIYFIAVAVDTVGTTAGVACHSGSTGRIGILPTAWPGNLDIDAASPKIDAMGFAQFAVTSGALPNPAAALALQAAWTGGFPAFFLDNNNA
jgi:hypothetical protein